MARQPSWLQKVNFIRKWISNPCDTPYAIYAETAIKPAGDLLLALIGFGLDDVVRGFFRPRGLRSRRHGRKGRKGSRPKELIPEVGEIIGKNIPGAEDVNARKVTDGVKTLWIVDGLLQRALYFWMMLSLPVDFGYDWISGIVRDDNTRCDGWTRMLRYAHDNTVLGLLQWQAIGLGTLNYQHGDITSNAFACSVGPGLYQAVVACTAQTSDRDENLCDLRIRVVGGPDDGVYPTGAKQVPANSTVGLVASVAFRGPAAIGWEAGGGLGTWNAIDANVFVMGIG